MTAPLPGESMALGGRRRVAARDPARYDPDEARELVRFARARIREELGGTVAVPPRAAWCQEPGAAFVSLHWTDGTLHGCIGNLDAKRPLVDEVAAHAVAAACHDRRGGALVLEDVNALDVELSILGHLEPIAFRDEAEALSALRARIDGVALELGSRRATFLPQMWSQFGTAGKLVTALKLKAGLPSDFWSDDIRLWRYTAAIFIDPARTRSASGSPS
jgi:AmmeMemoRadiSam system protein A